MNRFRSLVLAIGTFVAAGCGGGRSPEAGGSPSAIPPQAEGANPQEVDSLFRLAENRVRHGKWGDAIKHLERTLLEFSPGDSRIPQARYFLGEAKLAILAGSLLAAVGGSLLVRLTMPDDWD